MTPIARSFAAVLLAVPFVSHAAATERPFSLGQILAVAKVVDASKTKSRGLAGSEGDVKRKFQFPPMTTGGCQNFYRRYVAAGGHSAYAGTPIDYFYGGDFACGLSVNAPTQAEAERRAVADCKLAIAQTKAKSKSTEFIGTCSVQASK